MAGSGSQLQLGSQRVPSFPHMLALVAGAAGSSSSLPASGGRDPRARQALELAAQRGGGIVLPAAARSPDVNAIAASAAAAALHAERGRSQLDEALASTATAHAAAAAAAAGSGAGGGSASRWRASTAR